MELTALLKFHREIGQRLGAGNAEKFCEEMALSRYLIVPTYPRTYTTLPEEETGC